jgi:excinuclease UvrABC ATPase subunit
MNQEYIEIRNAREDRLKSVRASIPKRKITILQEDRLKEILDRI